MTYEELGILTDEGDWPSDADPEDIDYYRATADEHNMHVAARIAYQAPPSATIAEIYTDTNQVGAYYDRDGTMISHLPERGHAETWHDPDHGVERFPAEVVTDPEVENEQHIGDSTFIDLESARQVSDAYLEHRRAGGADVPAPRTCEGQGLQRRSTLREIDMDSDEVFDGDHVEAWVNGGTVTSTSPETYPGSFEEGSLAFVQGDGHTMILSASTLCRDGVAVYTDRQRALNRSG